MSKRILGIDLGTTNSLVSVYEGGSPTVLSSFEGGRLFPSVVAFTDKGELLVGEHAKRQAVLNPANTVASVKQLMGRKFYSEEVQKAMGRSSVAMRAAENGDVVLTLLGKDYTPAEVSAIILRRLREIAEEYYGEAIEKAVITVPAYFNFTQREATKSAGRIAKLDVVRVLSEPTAAAVAFGLGKNMDRTVAVYDLGGGTFDISIMDIREGVFKVRAVAGDNRLGGDDFDARIVAWMLGEWEREQGTSLRSNAVALQRVREAAETVKKELSLSHSAQINIPFLAPAKDGQPGHLVRTLSRAEFEEMVGPLVDQTFERCEEALRLAGLKLYDVTDVILAGGQTRSPIVYEKVARYFNKMPLKGVNPDEAVAQGAALLGAVIGGHDLPVNLMDVTAFSMGVEVDGGRMSAVVPRNSQVPCKVTRMFTTYHDSQDHVTVNVLQGESPYAAYNQSLVRFDLAPIPRAPAGVPDIEVEFAIDESGILSVTALDKQSGKAQNVRITESAILSLREIEGMSRKVDDIMVSDQERRELGELKNHALYLVSRIHTLMADHGAKLGEAGVAQLTRAMAELERVATFDDASLIDAARRVIGREQEAAQSQVRSLKITFDLKRMEG